LNGDVEGYRSQYFSLARSIAARFSSSLIALLQGRILPFGCIS
jgi:hypothetical protein